MRSQFEEVYIVSADKADLPLSENERRQECLEGFFRYNGIPFKPVVGYFEGNKEQSYVVSSRHKAIVLPEVFGRYWQDSVLLLDLDRKAYLVKSPRGPKENPSEVIQLGQWRAVSEEIAKSKQAYTFDPETGIYYVAD